MPQRSHGDGAPVENDLSKPRFKNLPQHTVIVRSQLVFPSQALPELGQGRVNSGPGFGPPSGILGAEWLNSRAGALATLLGGKPSLQSVQLLYVQPMRFETCEFLRGRRWIFNLQTPYLGAQLT